MNGERFLELFLTGIAAVAGVLVLCFRYRLATYLLAEESREVRGWKKAVPLCFLLGGQMVLIWAIVYGFRQFGITVEPAQP